MKKLQALIFDVDGTLANTERNGHRVAFNRAFAEANLNWNWSLELYGQLLAISGGKERIKFYIRQYDPPRPSSTSADELAIALHELKSRHYQQLLSTGVIPLRIGVKRLLSQARAEGIPLAIATTSTLPNVMALLEQTLDPSWFEIIAAGDIVPAKKPAPDIYQYVLEKMNWHPDNCLVFEDSYHGVTAATKAGLKTIVTVNNYTKNHDFRDAMLVLNHFGEPDRPFVLIQGNLKKEVRCLNLDVLNSLLENS